MEVYEVTDTLRLHCAAKVGFHAVQLQAIQHEEMHVGTAHRFLENPHDQCKGRSRAGECKVGWLLGSTHTRSATLS